MYCIDGESIGTIVYLYLQLLLLYYIPVLVSVFIYRFIKFTTTTSHAPQRYAGSSGRSNMTASSPPPWPRDWEPWTVVEAPSSGTGAIQATTGTAVRAIQPTARAGMTENTEQELVTGRLIFSRVDIEAELLTAHMCSFNYRVNKIYFKRTTAGFVWDT